MDMQKRKEELCELDERIARSLQTIRRRIVVLSGKGGVGKTTVSIGLALGLMARGHTVGLIDADVTGPNVPKMLGISDPLIVNETQIIPQKINELKVVSVANACSPDAPIMWRGPRRSMLLTQFLADVRWGNLDYLVADLPPGTGDEAITLGDKMRPHLAVVVTTPQEVSLIDSRRAIEMARNIGIPYVGLVENMSGLVCPHCGNEIEIFSKGGGKKQARQLSIPFFGSIPFDITMREHADRGTLACSTEHTPASCTAITKIIETIDRALSKPAPLADPVIKD